LLLAFSTFLLVFILTFWHTPVKHILNFNVNNQGKAINIAARQPSENSIRPIVMNKWLQGLTATMNVKELEEYYYIMVQQNTIVCPKSQRFGKAGDGGWDLCLSDVFTPKAPCLSYSFGVNHVWEFDDEVANKLGCEVRAFDPSMKSADQKHAERVWYFNLGIGGKNETLSTGWKINTFSSILKRHNHETSIIDILKMDVEYWEWSVLENILADGSLKKVKQLLIETHTGNVPTVDLFRFYLTLLKQLYHSGFRMWKSNWNHLGTMVSVHTGKRLTCCFEMYFVNVNFLPDPSIFN